MNNETIVTNYRVLMVGNFFLSRKGGTQPVAERLSQRFIAEGWHVKVTSHRHSRLLRIADMLKTAFQYRREYDVAIVDVFSGAAFIWAEAVAWWLRRLHKPYILTLRGGNLPQFSERYPKRVKRLLQAADTIVTPSNYLCEHFSPWRDDIQVLPNGLDLDSFTFRLRESPFPYLAWLRAFHYIYKPTVVPDVVANLVSEFPELKLIMYGPDKNDGSLAEMQQQADVCGVNEHIEIFGSIPNTSVPELLSQHDIFLNTTTAESFGVAVMEAAALGMCIVTTNVGELSYIWSDGEDVLLVPPNDPNAMAHAVYRILTEPGLATRLSRNARAKSEKYKWKYVIPQWEQVVKSTQDAK